MLTGHRVILRTVREEDLDGLFDLIADVRTIGDHWPLRIGSESEWRKKFHENGWWSEDFGRMLLTDRDGERLGYLNYYMPSHSYHGREIGEFKVFPVPQEALQDRKLTLAWDRPTDEEDLNWRQQSRVCEVWLLKQPRADR